MTWWLTYGGWVAAGVLAIVAAWLWTDLDGDADGAAGAGAAVAGPGEVHA